MPNSSLMINTFVCAILIWHCLSSCYHHGLQFEFIWELFGMFQELFGLVSELFEFFRELFESFWELFRLFWGMFGSRDSLHRAKNASIDFGTRRVVFFQVARGRVD